MLRGAWRVFVSCGLAGALFITAPVAAAASRHPDSAARVGQVQPPVTSDHIGLFAQDWNSAAANRSDAAWVSAARANDVMVGIPNVYCDHMTQIRSAHPKAIILVYDLGPYTQRGTPLYDRLLRDHPDYFARDAAGNLLTVTASSGSPSFPANTLMNPNRTGWRAEHAQRISDLIAKCGFDGVYVDSMGNGPLTGTTTGIPINPATGRNFTEVEWMKALGGSMGPVKTKIGTKFLMTSGLGNGISYQTSTHFLAEAPIDGIMTDSWMRLASYPVSTYPSTGLFQANLDMVEDLQAKGKSFFGWTKVWLASASSADHTAWDRFGLASYLLVRRAHAYYSYSTSLGADRTIVDHSFEQANLGRALGPYTVSGGVYRRQFEHGNVTVDPANHTASIVVN